MTNFTTAFSTLADMVNEMSPYLLLGFLFAGMLHVYVPQAFYRRYLSQDNLKSVTLATLFGIPLPLCSCGVIPTAMGLRREGVSRSATISFLIATPQTGVDSILATFAMMGLPFAILRPTAALVSALTAGMLCVAVYRRSAEPAVACPCPQPATKVPTKRRFLDVLRYGYLDMLQDIGGHLAVGLLIAVLIQLFVPTAFLATLSQYPALEMLVMLLIAIPMYVCATGSIPIAVALMLKGLSPGAALVLLMAGPAVNMASLMVIGKVMGKKSLLLYLAGIVLGAVGFGLLANYALPREWFTYGLPGGTAHCHAASTPLWRWGLSALFLLLLGNALIRKYFKRKQNIPVMNNEIRYQVGGMSCNHCKRSMENGLAQVQGIESVEADPSTNIVYVKGTPDDAKVKAAVEELGFDYIGRVEEG